jgi:hypothetical protein
MKFHNFSGSTTFMLRVSPFEAIWKIQNFQISKIQTYFTSTKLIQIKNGSTTKFYNFWRWTAFILVICSSGIVVATFFTSLIHLSHSFFKLHKRYRFCEQNYYHFVKWSNNPNKNCTCWQVMKVWNFVVYNFFIWQCFTALKRDCWFCIAKAQCWRAT